MKWGKGGVGVLNWPKHCDAFQAHWMVRYLDPTRGNWKILIDHWVYKLHTGRHGILSKKVTGHVLFHGHKLLNFFAHGLETFHKHRVGNSTTTQK